MLSLRLKRKRCFNNERFIILSYLPLHFLSLILFALILSFFLHHFVEICPFFQLDFPWSFN